MNASLIVVLALGGVAALIMFMKHRGGPPAGASAPSAAPMTSPVVPMPAPVNPLAAMDQAAESFMHQEIYRNVGAHKASKWAADMAEALNRITGPPGPKS